MAAVFPLLGYSILKLPLLGLVDQYEVIISTASWKQIQVFLSNEAF